MMNSNELFGFDNTFIQQTFAEYLSCSMHPVMYWRAKLNLWEQMTHGLTLGLSTPVCSKIQWQAGLGSNHAAPPQSSHHIWALTLWVCGSEKGWFHLSSSSRLICKTRIILTQFAVLWQRISKNHSGLVFIYSEPDGFTC